MVATSLMQPESRGRLLLVDDDEHILRSVARVLRLDGYEVLTVRSAEEASAAMDQGEIDAVVTDILLPRLDGLGLLRLVRDRDPKIPVLLVTGNPSLESATQAVEFGAFRYLVKPFDIKSLEHAVSEAVSTYRLTRIKRAVRRRSDSGLATCDIQSLDASLNGALDSFRMAYQPIVSIQSREVIGYEALLRPESPSFSGPMELFHAAEQMGRMQELGRRIRALVAKDAAEIPTASIFVNLHPSDLLDPELYNPSSSLAGVAHRLVLEITERATLDTVPDVKALMTRLRSMGFRIAVDDLGAGYSGLSSLASLNPDVVKVDMSIVRDIHLDATKQRLLRSIVPLFREMQVLWVVEGVETNEERDALLGLGCDVMQGYLFGRPRFDFAPIQIG
jgi:EAL domain-containing protein (putative c-di-GMP-specific phosphodiesterase class I)/ActR/RegA family two-component response regulator